MPRHPFLGWELKAVESVLREAPVVAHNASAQLAHGVHTVVQFWEDPHNSAAHLDEDDPRLFKREDLTAWIVFTVVFFFLIFLDNWVLFRKRTVVSFGKACLFVAFWFSCACCFCTWIYFHRGSEDAFDWAVGYLLEWTLSIDNLFIFHMVFKKFGTPDDLKARPLFWGIMGAIVFRFIFFTIGEAAMHTFWWARIIMAVFLIYTGFKIAATDEDTDDPQKNPIFIWLSKHIPVVNGYDPHGRFCIRCKVHPVTGEAIVPKAKPGSDSDGLVPSSNASRADSVGSSEFGDAQPIIFDDKEYYETEVTDKDLGKPDEKSTESQGSNGTTGSGGNSREQESQRAQERENTRKDQIAKREERRKEKEKKYKWRATLLVLVVLCFELTDVIISVDSVSTIVAQIPDLYLAYTACTFALLGFRATFFVIEALVRLFALLRYGVAFTLVFIGMKLLLKGWIHVPAVVVFGILVSAIGMSMAASIVYEHCRGEKKPNEGASSTRSDRRAHA